MKSMNIYNWKKKDYLKAYCDKGVETYLQMQKFMNDYPDFSISVCQRLLTNNKPDFSFEKGNLTIENLEQSYENAKKVLMFKPYYEGFNRSVFVAALIDVFKNENYNHAEMISKLSHQPSALTHCTDVIQYKILIQKIYNS